MYLFPFVFFIALLFSIIVKGSKKSSDNDIEAFWQREYEANNAPAKDISNLDYITISLEALPFLENPPENIARYEKNIRTLAGCKIVNLNGISNTELKLRYGVTNLTKLAQYDENYSSMQRAFTAWGRELYRSGYPNEAVTVLEYALDLGCDAKNIFLTLKELYKELYPERMPQLILRASVIKSSLKDSILAELQA